MEDQYTAMKCAVEEKEEIIRAVNRELVALNGALETVQQRVLELSEKNEMLEENLRANQVILNSLVSIFITRYLHSLTAARVKYLYFKVHFCHRTN